MSLEELKQVLGELLAAGESEVVEFKRAGNDFNTDKIGAYFSALANEANLSGTEAAWLVFGVDDRTRTVVGTDYRKKRARLDSLKLQINQDTDPRVSFREIHMLDHSAGRVIFFRDPTRPTWIPDRMEG